MPLSEWLFVSSRIQVGLGIALVLGLGLWGLRRGAALVAQLGTTAETIGGAADVRCVLARPPDRPGGRSSGLSRLGGADAWRSSTSQAWPFSSALVSRANHALRTPVASLTIDHRGELAEGGALRTIAKPWWRWLRWPPTPRSSSSRSWRWGERTCTGDLVAGLRRAGGAGGGSYGGCSLPARRKARSSFRCDLAPSLIAWADRARLRGLLEVCCSTTPCAIRAARRARPDLRAAAAVSESAPASGVPPSRSPSAGA